MSLRRFSTISYGADDGAAAEPGDVPLPGHVLAVTLNPHYLDVPALTGSA